VAFSGLGVDVQVRGRSPRRATAGCEARRCSLGGLVPLGRLRHRNVVKFHDGVEWAGDSAGETGEEPDGMRVRRGGWRAAEQSPGAGLGRAGGLAVTLDELRARGVGVLIDANFGEFEDS
jgi:hypothetical protein